jgi:hypothetical protein
VLLFGLSVKTPWQFLRGAVQGSAEAPGHLAAAFRSVVVLNFGLGPLRATERGLGPPCFNTATDQ